MTTLLQKMTTDRAANRKALRLSVRAIALRVG